MEFSPLESLSPLDGRYRNLLTEMADLFSEYALIKKRVHIECDWLSFLIRSSFIFETLSESKNSLLEESKDINININININTRSEKTENHEKALSFLSQLKANFSHQDAQKIKNFEQVTQHDLKAVEYFIKHKLEQENLNNYKEWVHFGCTSEDINNLSYSLMLQEGVQWLLQKLESLLAVLQNQARQYAAVPMLSRTHGQAATPTTLGKEFANYYARLIRQLKQLKDQEFLGKFGGAVGNFNAHTVAYPNINWPEIAERFVSSLGLVYNPLTTQIEPHDFIAELAHTLIRVNTVLLDFSKNIWGYVALNYFSQKAVDGEVGSSTMPHKINPILFENSEGNLGLANALLSHMAEKLPISRFQRDLSDSTVLRNLGAAMGYSYLAYVSLEKGLKKLKANTEFLEAELENKYEILTEAIQTVMRKYQLESAYEKLKDFSRGQTVTQKNIHEFIKNLELPSNIKKQLLELEPKTYLGYAKKLAERV